MFRSVLQQFPLLLFFCATRKKLISLITAFYCFLLGVNCVRELRYAVTQLRSSRRPGLQTRQGEVAEGLAAGPPSPKRASPRAAAGPHEVVIRFSPKHLDSLRVRILTAEAVDAAPAKVAAPCSAPAVDAAVPPVPAPSALTTRGGGAACVGTQLTVGCDHWLFVHVIALTPNGLLSW